MSTVRLLLDEHINPRVAGILKARGIDSLAVAGSEHCGLDDIGVLRLAAAQGRIVVTRDIGDFSEALVELHREAGRTPGVVFVNSRAFPAPAIARLAHALSNLVRRIEIGEADATGGIHLEP